jgi:hypothetical protein
MTVSPPPRGKEASGGLGALGTALSEAMRRK